MRTIRYRSASSRLAGAALLAAVLGGCNASPELTLASSAPYTPEWCGAAKSLANGSGSNLFATGRCHELGIAGFPKDENVVRFYYRESARWGNLQAGEALARLGEPVPFADLQADASDRAERRRMQDAMTAGMAGRPVAGPVRPAFTPNFNFQSQITPPRIGGPSPMSAPTPMPAAPSFGRPTSMQSQSSVSTSSQTSTQSRQECSNGICRTVTTRCTAGVCTTQ